MKNIKTLFLALIIATTFITPKKSEAAIGLATGTTPLVIAGIAAPLAVGGVLELAEGTDDMRGMAFWIGAIVIGIPLGIILLDGEEEQAIEYTLMDEKMANKMGVTRDEMNSFNQEIDQANVLLEEVALETETLDNPTAEDVRGIWENYQDFVSPETFSVMEKIGAQFAK
ncbi:MAG: hypothetical protein CME62_12350 [Halobacteriovoraceae bacterium]|nr:hypothetical protein [Halobacteriovoraceae bacterium]|tara:strand:+ start:9058 stop:9567 length:510 start_codon:yes stop_codon:yes gene_type:complete